MKKSHCHLLWLLVALSAGTSQLLACSSRFKSCVESRTCAAAGSAGAAGEPASSGATDGGDANADGGSSGATVASGADAGGNAGTSVGGGAGGSAGTSGNIGAGAGGSAGTSGNIGAGGSAGTSGGGNGGSVAVDSTPPKVLSVIPADGAKGVRADAKITLKFSEPVDRASAQAAVSTSAGGLTFAWNAASTELTCTPTNLLSYAGGATAKTYTVQVSTGLKDVAGNHAAAFSSSFATLRQLSLKITRPAIGTYTVCSGEGGSAYANAGDSSPDMGDGYSNFYCRSFPDFDIGGLPTALTNIVMAVMSIPISTRNPVAGELDWGAPFTDLGNLLVDHIYDFPIQLSSLTKAALSNVGTLMTAPSPEVSIRMIDVTAAVSDDVTNRSARRNHSMYRLQFAKTTDNDSSLDLVAIPFNATMTLDVVYLIP